MILLIKIVLREEIINIVRAYPPQVGLEESVEQIFWRKWINWFKGYQMVKIFLLKET